MYLFDTNVVSEFHKLAAGRCDEAVEAWTSEVDVSASYLSVITLLEIELGILRIERTDAKQGDSLREWFQGLCNEYRDRIVSVDAAVALKAASLHVPNPKSERDALIAASNKIDSHN